MRRRVPERAAGLGLCLFTREADVPKAQVVEGGQRPALAAQFDKVEKAQVKGAARAAQSVAKGDLLGHGEPRVGDVSAETDLEA